MNEREEDLQQDLSIDEFWEQNHKGNLKGHRFWLTGSAGPYVWNNLQVRSLIKPGRVVLNIGVGEGHCTRDLVERKCTVHVLDISPAALNKVRDIVAGCWLPDTFEDMPASHFDLAFSHLVAQHMSNRDLSRQISAVLRALKPTGIFAMQFACSQNPGYNSPDEAPMELIKSGGVVRSLAGLSTMVEAAGGVVLWANRIGIFPTYGSGWYAVHIARADYPFVNSIPLQKPPFLRRVYEYVRARCS